MFEQGYHIILFVVLFMSFLYGGVATINGLYYIRRNKKQQACTVKTVGIVSEVYYDEIDRYKYNLRPIYGVDNRIDNRTYHLYYHEFTYSDGLREYKKRSVIGTEHMPRFSKGKKVTIYYNPKNPDDYYVEQDKVKVTAKVNYISIAAGIFFMILSLTLFLYFLGYLFQDLFNLFLE